MAIVSNTMTRSIVLALLLCTTLPKIKLRIIMRKKNLCKEQTDDFKKMISAPSTSTVSKMMESNGMLRVSCRVLLIFLFNYHTCFNGWSKITFCSGTQSIFHASPFSFFSGLLLFHRVPTTSWWVAFFTMGLMFKISYFLLFTYNVAKNSRVGLCEGGAMIAKHHDFLNVRQEIGYVWASG